MISDKNSLTRVYGIGESIAIKLRSSGISTVEQLAIMDATQLFTIDGIDQRKAMELSGVVKYYLIESERDILKDFLCSVLKENKYRIIKNEGKFKTFFRDVDILALKPIISKKKKGVLIVFALRLFDLKKSLVLNSEGIKVGALKDDNEVEDYIKEVIVSNIYRLERSEKYIVDDLESEGSLFQHLNARWDFLVKKTFLGKCIFLHRRGIPYKLAIFRVLICRDHTAFSPNINTNTNINTSTATIPLPYHTQSHSYIINYAKFHDLLSYVKHKVQVFETVSNMNDKFTKYRKNRTVLKRLLLFWVFFYVGLGSLGILASSLDLPLLSYVLSLIGIVGSVLFFMFSCGFFVRLIRNRNKMSRKALMPYYKMVLNAEKAHFMLKKLGYSSTFRKQFKLEHARNND